MLTSNQDTGQKPVGEGEYEVQQGDCVESIAARFGHYWKTIWDHPKNGAVKSERRDPNVLLPGDRLHIPPLRLRELSKGSDSRHSFTRLGVPSKIVLKLAEAGRPRANEPFKAVIDGGTVIEGTTDGEGMIRLPIVPGAQEAIVTVGAGVLTRQTYHLQLGGMDPITTVTGVQKRLRNLGFACEATGELDNETRSALAFFQKANDLPATGDLDGATRDKLKQVYGC